MPILSLEGTSDNDARAIGSGKANSQQNVTPVESFRPNQNSLTRACSPQLLVGVCVCVCVWLTRRRKYKVPPNRIGQLIQMISIGISDMSWSGKDP